METNKLLECAKRAMEHSYSPYSKFSVGAAILCDDGTVFSGCNVENRSYPVGICAERAAISKAVSEGHKNFAAIAIYSSNNPCMPCGMCRQTLSEFCGDDLKIVLADREENAVTYTLGELLPKRF